MSLSHFTDEELATTQARTDDLLTALRDLVDDVESGNPTGAALDYAQTLLRDIAAAEAR